MQREYFDQNPIVVEPAEGVLGSLVGPRGEMSDGRQVMSMYLWGVAGFSSSNGAAQATYDSYSIGSLNFDYEGVFSPSVYQASAVGGAALGSAATKVPALGPAAAIVGAPATAKTLTDDASGPFVRFSAMSAFRSAWKESVLAPWPTMEELRNSDLRSPFQRFDEYMNKKYGCDE